MGIMKWRPVIVFWFLAAVMVSGCGAVSGDSGTDVGASIGTSIGTTAQGWESTGSSGEVQPSILPKITASPELMSPSKAVFSMEQDGEGDVIFFADVDHDGEPERIELNLPEYEEQGESSFLEVYSDEEEGSPVLWKRDYGTAHAGWITLYLYREDGRDYIMEYAPVMYQGYGSYFLRLFSLNSRGEPEYLREYETEFTTMTEKEDGSDSGFNGDTREFLSFMEAVETHIEEGLLMVSTDNGELAYSVPKNPIIIRHAEEEFD